MRPTSLLSSWRIMISVAIAISCLAVSTSLIVGQSADDHGNTPATATPLTLGTSIPGRIDPGDDVDVFVIDLTQASGLTDIWAYAAGELDTIGGLYDSEGVLLIINDDGTFRDNPHNFSLRKTVGPGIYYLIISSFLPESGDYVLHTQSVTEPGDTLETATALELGTPTAGTFFYEEDADYFRLDLTQPTYTIIEALNPNYKDLDAQLLDASGNELGENIYLLRRLFGHVHGDGFLIRDYLEEGTYYLKVVPTGRPSLRPVPYVIRALEDTVSAAYFAGCAEKTEALSNESIEDPLYGCQWHLESSEYVDINVETAWNQGILGEGVNIALVDRGMDYRHEDLKDNVDVTLNHDYSGEDDIYSRTNHHGTHVAGIIAARDNSVGIRGVAPRATLYGYNTFDGYYASRAEILDSMTRNAEVTAVSNNSWGNRDSVRAKRAATLWERAIETGLDEGYGGKGTFYVFSAGNGHLLGDDSNLDEYANFYGVTAACSVQGYGARAPYSEMGANLWVCAPSNERPVVQGLGGRFGIVTTENSDNYVVDFGGTSAAAPVISGVAALMRSANPDLTWRDLKLILAATAQKNDPGNNGWLEGARKYRSASATDRYHFNHEYGFGLVDAGEAVALAKQWVSVPELEIGSASSGKISAVIPDASLEGDATSTSSTVTFEGDLGFVEFVEVDISLWHRSFRDLDIELISPSGTVSRLAVPHDTSTDLFTYSDFVPLYGSFRFGSARHLGEDPNGDWTLRVTDRIHAGEGTLESWDISVFGHAPEPDAPEITTIEPGRGTLAVTWTASDETSDFDVTSYDLRYKRSEDNPEHLANWAIFRDVWTATGGGELQHMVTGLVGRTQYDVQMRAANRWGSGEWSVSATATPDNVLPYFSEGSTTTRFVLENTPAGGSVGDPVAVIDDDTPTYTISGRDVSLFDVDATSGQITVGPGTSLDYESGITEYSVAVTATDESLEVASIDVTIVVADESLGEIGDRYDFDSNETIDASEVMAAIQDYFKGLLSGEDALEVIRLYFSG